MKYSVYWIFISVFCCSCQQGDKTNHIAIREGTSIDTFRQLTSFPLLIKNVHWSIETHENKSGRSIPGPSDWSLFGEIKSDSTEVKRLKDAMEKGNNVISKEIYVDPKYYKGWLSTCLKGHFVKKDSFMILKSNIYKIDKKIFPVMSKNGWFTIIDNDIIFVVLSSS